MRTTALGLAFVTVLFTACAEPTAIPIPDHAVHEPGVMGWDVFLADGTYCFVLDWHAASAQEAIEICRDQELPTVAVLAPASGAVVGGVVDVAIAATDNVGLVFLAVYVDGQIAGSLHFCGLGVSSACGTDVPPLSHWQWNTLVGNDGPHMIYAVATDANANRSASRVVSVTVTNPVHHFAAGSFLNCGCTRVRRP